MTKKTLLLALIAFQCLILVGMFAKAFYPQVVGQKIRLHVIPRDPRDMLRGDYVDLGYTFSDLNYDTLPNDIDSTKTYRFGDDLYLELKKVGEFYEPAGLWQHPPAGKVFLHVTPEYAYNRTMTLKAGIESYFTNSENAKALENAASWINQDSLLVSVSVWVTNGGAARIEDIAVAAIRRSAESIRADSLRSIMGEVDAATPTDLIEEDSTTAPDSTGNQ